ncbi:hypothetical protein BUZ80_10280 [Staphylococcus saprophyticus]|uniref:P-loop NTPase fold protein n=1 Tax=Staphylococcus saprophyticus TaxID=29385 RepID=UPI000E67FBDC|nr:P-loop NTPase fold protein [Staphylococcus saprophyticus]RIO28303.1 hypothetical protein BUZ80_10280 [Staphylococcus saprophyticus]
MDKFKDAITNYIEKDENFALFIDGEWGTGKTHFFEYDYFLNKKEENQDKNNYKKEYISVYGKHSLKHIQEIIVTKLLNHVDDDVINQNIKKGLNNIFKLIDIKYLNNENITASIDDYLETKAINKIKANLNKNGSQIVLIIDDIERLSSGISLKEFLGFIRNVLLDSFNCKVTLVGNKNAMNNIHKNEMAEYSEKVISRTLKFPSNLEVGENILEDDLKIAYFEENEIKELKELIYISSLSESKSSVLNLRTLKLVITDFKNIYSQLEDNNKQANTRMSLFTSLFILHNVNRNNEVENEEKFKQLNSVLQSYLINPNKYDKLSNEEKIYKKYFEGNKTAKNYAYLSNELKDYILEGSLDVKIYQKQINDNFAEKDPVEDTLNILREFYLYDENIIKIEEEKAIAIINESKYAFVYRLNLYMLLNILKAKSVLFTNKYDLNKLEETLLCSYEPQKTNKPGGEIISNLTQYDFSWNREIEEVKKELTKKLKEKQSESMVSNGIYREYIDAILKTDHKTMDKLEQDYIEVLYLNIYEKFNEDIQHVEKTLLKNNAKIVELNRYLRRREIQHTTHNNVQLFKENINKIKAKAKDKITEYNLNALLDTLEENIKLFDFKKT